MTSPGPIYLVGFMGSGKTTVGRLLADALGRKFVDTDAALERSAGRSVARIFEERGEIGFRELELATLVSVDGPGTVVATGGGLFSLRGARLRIRERGWSVWLDAPFSALGARIDGSARPLWSTRSLAERRSLFERRRAVYALADMRVAAGPAPEAVARAILDQIPVVFR